MAPQGSQLKRCMECNYPTIQSGSGVSGIGQTDGSVKAAKQPTSGGYNPGVIIGKVE